MNDFAIVKNPNQHSYELISLFVLGGREGLPGPAYLLYSVLRYAAVKVPRGGSPGSRMLDLGIFGLVKP